MYSIHKLINTILQGDVLEQLKLIPTASIDCVITSPPYWQLRNYGFKQQWGLEDTFSEYLKKLWLMMDELKRIVKPTGTVWINLGDTYFGSGNGSGRSSQEALSKLQPYKLGKIAPMKANANKANQLIPKSLSLIPHRFAIGCSDRGWIVRNDIIWAKPNSLPESTKDRFSKKHEHIFLMTKQRDYYFDLDAVRDAHKTSSLNRVKYKVTAYSKDKENSKATYEKGNAIKHTKIKMNPLGKNPGDVTDFWVISNKGTKDNHFATFNTSLISKPILSGCPKGGIVLDPFCGTGTTGVEAIRLSRKFIGIDAKKEYVKIAKKNIEQIPSAENNYSTLLKKLSALHFTI
jgi:DNA modification methylase